MQLDDTDRAILACLQADARQSFRDVATATGISTPTVSARVRRLENVGLIRGYSAQLDSNMLAGTRIIVLARMRPENAQGGADALRAVAGVGEVTRLAGGLVLAHLSVETSAALPESLAAIEAIPGIERYDVHPVIATTAAKPLALDARTRLAVACDDCKGPIEGAGVHRTAGDGRMHVFCCRGCAARFDARLETLAAAARAPKRKNAASGANRRS